MDCKKKIIEAQKYLKEALWDGWLLYDFHKNNPLAHRFLEIPPSVFTTRRFFYWIPKEGPPIKIVHAIEPHILDAWPGEKKLFLSWQSLEKTVASILKGSKKIAMEYSPRNAIPYISHVDGGTIDLIRSMGVEVVSSGSFLPHFTAVLTPEQGEGHRRAAKALDQIVNQTWRWIAEQIQRSAKISEYDVQQKIADDFKRAKLVTDHLPIVACNGHSADPHYEPKAEGSALLKKGDFILIDLWAKEEGESSVFADMTRVAVAASAPTDLQQKIFHIVRKAQKAAIELVFRRRKEKMKIEGWEVDRAARDVIEAAGYGEFFLHRTGHSIETSLHGSGANIDDLEMHDTRPILFGTCFSIEPGIYLPQEFGVRLETDLYIHHDGTAEVTGGEEEDLLALF
jgi:Xaa-Pro dipeptidase